MGDCDHVMTTESPFQAASRSTDTIYDPVSLLGRAQEWRRRAETTSAPGMRAFCLGEASRWENAVQRSFETPPVTDNVPLSGSFRRATRRMGV